MCHCRIPVDVTDTQREPAMSEDRTRTHEGFSAEERAAMKERAKEIKQQGRSRVDKAAKGEQDLLAKIAAMSGSDRVMAERVHAIVQATAPMLEPRTWYGMPAYTLDGTNVCFFQPAEKFQSRYATIGFEAKANLDDGAMWATAFALTEITPDVEARIAALLKQAVS